MFPLLIDVLLAKTGGLEWTLRILGLLIAVCGGAALMGVKPRVPIAHLVQQGPRRAIIMPDLGFMRSYEFICMVRNYSSIRFTCGLWHLMTNVKSITIMAQGLAYYPVSLYIPAFSTAVGLSTLTGTIALAVFNLSGVVGE